MNKKRLFNILIILFSSLILTSCQIKFNVHNHSWSKFYDNGDGTHTRTCLTDISHKESEEHTYNDGTIIEEIDGKKLGKIKYTCTKCGFSKVEALYPSDQTHTLDKCIVNDTYLYENSSDYSSIYYKSCEHGYYGDENYLFEKTLIDGEYTLVDYIKGSNGSINLNLDNDGSYGYSTVNSIQTSSRLPNGYTEVSYIKTNGTQYIDLNYNVVGGIHCIYKASFQSYDYIIGTHNATYPFGRCGVYLHSGNYFEFGYGELCQHSDIEGELNTIYTIEYSFSPSLAWAKINDELTSFDGQQYYSGEQTINNNLVMFREGDYRPEVMCSATLYSAKVYDLNEELIFDLVPCINIDNEVGLYNLVDNTFYTSTIGDRMETGDIIVYNATSRLPSEYTEVEYIESTGTQYIDTGLPTKDGWKCDISYEYTSLDRDDVDVMGTDGDSSIPYSILINYANGSQRSVVDSNCIVTYSICPEISKRYNSIISFNDTSFTHYIDGTLAHSSIISKYNSINNVYLFARNCYNTALRYSECKIYYCKLYDEDTLVRYLIPCIKNDNSEAGLYDLINDEFYQNQGTGNFIAGSELTYSNTISSSLPNGYQQVEYIESTGSQYIDTNVVGQAKWIYDIEFTDTTKRQLMGHSGSGGEYWGVTDGYYGKATWSTSSVSIGNRDIYQVNNFPNTTKAGIGGYVYINNEYAYNNNYDSKSELGSATLFALSENFYCYCKLYSCKVYDINNNLIRDYIPSIRLGDGEVGLYDLVNNEFYENLGTNDFLYGNTVSSSSKLPSNYTELTYVDQVNVEASELSQHNRCEISDITYNRIETYLNYNGCGATNTAIIFSGLNCYWRHSTNGAEDGTNPYNPIVSPSVIPENTWTTVTYNFEKNYTGLKTCGWTDKYNSWEAQSVKISYFKTYVDDELTGYFIACKNKNDEIGFYDIVNNKFYTNTGSGAFLEGEEVIYNNSYISNIKFSSSTTYTLPTSYQELTNIELYNQNYIDSEVILKEDTRIELSFKYNQETNDILIYINDNFNVSIIDNKLVLKTALQTYTSPIELDTNTIYKLILGSNSNYTITNESNSLVYVFDSVISNSSDTIRLLNNTNDNGSIYIYRLYIYESNTLKYKFIPSLNKSNNQIGLYDLVNNKFIESNNDEYINKGFNENTSSLLDTEISNISLPSNYIQIDYIEGNGKGYIDTNISYDLSTKYTFKYEIEYTSLYSSTLMGFDSTLYYSIGINDKNTIIGTNSKASLNKIYGLSYTIYGNSYESNAINNSIDGTISNTIINDDEIPSFLLFTTYDNKNDDTYYLDNVRLYSFKIYENDCLVRYYVPCFENSTHQYGFYDVVNNNFVTSSSNLYGGNNDLYRIDNSKVNLLYSNKNNVISYLSKSISTYYIYDSNNNLVKQLVSVIRNSDGKLGLYDIVNDQFYEVEGEVEYGSILGHNYDEGTTIKEPTYNEEGIIEYNCDICGSKITKTIDRLSYKITFNTASDIKVYTYKSNNINEYEESNIAYSINKYTYNYSKNNSMVYFKVECDNDYDIVISDGTLINLGNNQYRIEDLREDTTVTIKTK